ncbi:ribosome maturation factor RimM [Spirochaetia bacterium]|nr:ribosome maturation factor RimM [Spirochaetia bacterium]
MTEQFVVGLLGAPFGLNGFIKVRSLSGENGHILKLDSILVRQGGLVKTCEVEETVESGAALLIKFKGIDSPEAAKTLNGAELLAGRDQAAALGQDEYYVEDLRGIEVVAAPVSGEAAVEVLGTVTDILEGGGGELLEMRLPGGELRLVPFRKESFGAISLEHRRIVLLARWVLE